MCSGPSTSPATHSFPPLQTTSLSSPQGPDAKFLASVKLDCSLPELEVGISVQSKEAVLTESPSAVSGSVELETELAEIWINPCSLKESRRQDAGIHSSLLDASDQLPEVKAVECCEGSGTPSPNVFFVGGGHALRASVPAGFTGAADSYVLSLFYCSHGKMLMTLFVGSSGGIASFSPASVWPHFACSGIDGCCICCLPNRALAVELMCDPLPPPTMSSSLMVTVVWLRSHIFACRIQVRFCFGGDVQPTTTHYAFLLMVLVIFEMMESADNVDGGNADLEGGWLILSIGVVCSRCRPVFLPYVCCGMLAWSAGCFASLRHCVTLKLELFISRPIVVTWLYQFPVGSTGLGCLLVFLLFVISYYLAAALLLMVLRRIWKCCFGPSLLNWNGGLVHKSVFPIPFLGGLRRNIIKVTINGSIPSPNVEIISSLIDVSGRKICADGTLFEAGVLLTAGLDGEGYEVPVPKEHDEEKTISNSIMQFPEMLPVDGDPTGSSEVGFSIEACNVGLDAAALLVGVHDVDSPPGPPATLFDHHISGPCAELHGQRESWKPAENQQPISTKQHHHISKQGITASRNQHIAMGTPVQQAAAGPKKQNPQLKSIIPVAGSWQEALREYREQGRSNSLEIGTRQPRNNIKGDINSSILKAAPSRIEARKPAFHAKMPHLLPLPHWSAEISTINLLFLLMMMVHEIGLYADVALFDAGAFNAVVGMFAGIPAGAYSFSLMTIDEGLLYYATVGVRVVSSPVCGGNAMEDGVLNQQTWSPATIVNARGLASKMPTQIIVSDPSQAPCDVHSASAGFTPEEVGAPSGSMLVVTATGETNAVRSVLDVGAPNVAVLAADSPHRPLISSGVAELQIQRESGLIPGVDGSTPESIARITRKYSLVDAVEVY
ncbi:hypothetical protein Nepgr_033758 [Nepenthes gracilis]|uniref:Uncharacterized protein n=1 Tax=Nepenthes gracilis TaxID=150966 RepID=A0AAD3TME2_NEPGR|nr:hypothetical protein Nepgr_033758 [Nepenthes gracilis]